MILTERYTEMDVGQIFTTRPTSWVIRPQPSAAGNRSIKNSVGTDLAITNFVKFKKKLYLDFLNLLLYTCMLRSDPIYTTLRMDPSQCPTVECCVYMMESCPYKTVRCDTPYRCIFTRYKARITASALCMVTTAIRLRFDGCLTRVRLLVKDH